MACRVSTEKSAIILLLEDPLYMSIPCCFQDFVFQQFNFSVSLCISLCSGIMEHFWMCRFKCFIEFGEFGAVISSDILSTPLFLLLLEIPQYLCQYA